MQSPAERITVEEAADRTGASVATVRRWCAEGRIDAVKIGKQWLIDPGSLKSIRPSRQRQSKVTDIGYNLELACQHIKSADISEMWVPDVVRFRDFADRPQAIIREAADRLESLRFMPALAIDVPKTIASNRPGVMLDIADRVAYQAVVGSFTKLIDDAISSNVYSSRMSSDPKYFFERFAGGWKGFSSSVRDELARGRCAWIAQTDITGYFEHIHHNLLFEDLSNVGVSGPPLRALRVMLSRWSTVDGIGLPQGPNVSRLLGNFYLVAVDSAMESRGYIYRRYMDDIRILAETKSAGVAAMRDFERFCRERGLSCSSSKTKVLSAEDYLAESDRADLDAAGYFFDSEVIDSRPLLHEILKRALADQGIDVSGAKFSLWRMSRLRDPTAIKLIFKKLEHLAPIASVVGAYLRPFISRDAVRRRLVEFMTDEERSYSHFLRTWLYAAMLEARDVPDEWAEIARVDAMNLNLPSYLRSVASCVIAKNREPRDIAWIKNRLSLEHDPDVLRAHLVAMKYARALDKRLLKVASDRQPALAEFGEWLLGQGGSLPSLLSADRKISLS